MPSLPWPVAVVPIPPTFHLPRPAAPAAAASGNRITCCCRLLHSCLSPPPPPLPPCIGGCPAPRLGQVKLSAFGQRRGKRTSCATLSLCNAVHCAVCTAALCTTETCIDGQMSEGSHASVPVSNACSRTIQRSSVRCSVVRWRRVLSI